jgi:hypothetical protein
MAKITNAEMVLRGLATMKPELIEGLLKAQVENIEASGLDPQDICPCQNRSSRGNGRITCLIRMECGTG